MNSTLLNERRIVYRLPKIGATGSSSLIGLLLLASILTILLTFNREIFSVLLVAGFGGYGLYCVTVRNHSGWFSVVCFFCGAESILRNGLPAGYMFFFFYLIASGILFILINQGRNRLKLFSPTGLILALAILHFLHLDLQELRFGIGKWGLIWLGLFFGMWISQSIKLNIDFYKCIWFYMLGSLMILFLFLMAPGYHDGRFWPTFDGTGPVAASIGLLVLLLIQQINPKLWLSMKNIVLGAILVASMAALVMLGSRGTFLGIAVAMLFFLYTMPGFWNKFLVALSIVCMAWLIYYIDQSSIGNEVLSSRLEEATETDTREGRRFINSAVFLSFSENPILGKGTGSWRHYNNEYIARVFDRRYPKDQMMTDAHSTPLHLLFEHGIVGAGLFLVVVFLMVKRSYLLSKYTGIFVLPLILFSFSLGLTTMHKQAPMFLPFFLSVMLVYRRKVHVAG
jgi:O-Antigen ligase